MYVQGKNMAYLVFGTVRGFKHLLGVSEHMLRGQRGTAVVSKPVCQQRFQTAVYCLTLKSENCLRLTGYLRKTSKLRQRSEQKEQSARRNKVKKQEKKPSIE